MFEQGPQTISTDPGPSPCGCQSPPQADGSRTRKDGSQGAFPFGSSPCARPLGMAAWRGGCGGPEGTQRCSPGHCRFQARLFVQPEHGRASTDRLPRSLRPLPQRSLWKLRGQSNSRVTKSYYGKSNPFTRACWLCRLRQKQLLSRQQLYHRRVHLCQEDGLGKNGNMEENRYRCGLPGKGGKEMGHKGGLVLLFSAQSLSLTSRTPFKGVKTCSGYTALGPGAKQGQGTRKKDTTPTSSPSRRTKEREGLWDV